MPYERRRGDEWRPWEAGRPDDRGIWWGPPRPYLERPEVQSEFDRVERFPAKGGGWYSGDSDRSRGRYAGSWNEGGEDHWGGSAPGPGYGGQGWRGYGEGWTGERREARYGRGREQDRSWFDRAADEVSSWFGDDDADRRRRRDQERGHYGKGPRGYSRSDERIREDVNDRLTDDWQIDASEIEAVVSNGEVTLNGTVISREEKRRAEDLAETVSGVRHVQNNLRVQRSSSR